MLEECARLNISPSIFVASQDKLKTEKLIKFLASRNFNFKVVSEYSIIHILKQIDLAIFGGLTLNSHTELILGPGSGSLMAQLKNAGIPLYAFLTRKKFSFWREKHTTAYSEVREKSLSDIHYSKVVFSHDVVQLSILTGLITESGVLTPDDAISEHIKLRDSFYARENKISELAKKIAH